MSTSREEKTFFIDRYPFDKDTIHLLSQNIWFKESWPLVYILSSAQKKVAYIGESTNAFARLMTHLAHPKKKQMECLHLITSPHFHKSATLDLEADLIRYFTGDTSADKYQLLNGNLGLTYQNYYEKGLYKALFTEVWKKLQNENIAIQDLRTIDNSDLFKYSPYKALRPDQYQSVLELIDLLNETDVPGFVQGSAGTGKTVVAIFLIKLLVTPIEELLDIDEVRDKEEPSIERKLIIRLKELFPKPKVALVIPVTPLRKTLKRVFRGVKGLNAGMVVGPSEVIGKGYDILIVDESHRLRQRKNLTGYGSFDANNKKLGLGDDGTELDWILASSKKKIFFYDRGQSVKPSDVPEGRFLALKPFAKVIRLQSQLRVKAGTDYITYVEDLLNVRLQDNAPRFEYKGYEFLLFDHMADMAAAIAGKEKEHQLSRMVAGYSWKWKSKTEPTAMDIEIEGMHFQWNREYNEWINSKNAANEIGCIHTTQRYDLNYVGVIFGNEIGYDPDSKEIIIRPEHYYDQKTKAGITDMTVLKRYIINIYQNMLYRGIMGAFVYVCDPELKAYFKRHICLYNPL